MLKNAIRGIIKDNWKPIVIFSTVITVIMLFSLIRTVLPLPPKFQLMFRMLPLFLGMGVWAYFMLNMYRAFTGQEADKKTELDDWTILNIHKRLINSPIFNIMDEQWDPKLTPDTKASFIFTGRMVRQYVYWFWDIIYFRLEDIQRDFLYLTIADIEENYLIPNKVAKVTIIFDSQEEIPEDVRYVFSRQIHDNFGGILIDHSKKTIYYTDSHASKMSRFMVGFFKKKGYKEIVSKPTYIPEEDELCLE